MSKKTMNSETYQIIWGTFLPQYKDPQNIQNVPTSLVSAILWYDFQYERWQ